MRSTSQQQLFPGQISSLERHPASTSHVTIKKKRVSYTALPAAAKQTALAQIFQLFSFAETPKPAKLQLAQEINVWKSCVEIQSRAWGELLPALCRLLHSFQTRGCDFQLLREATIKPQTSTSLALGIFES